MLNYKNEINDWTSDSINSNKNTINGSYQDYKMSKCITKNITYFRKPSWSHLNGNMKEQLVLLGEELGKLITIDDFEDHRSSITQQHKTIDILNKIEPFGLKRTSITKPFFRL